MGMQYNLLTLTFLSILSSQLRKSPKTELHRGGGLMNKFCNCGHMDPPKGP